MDSGMNKSEIFRKNNEDLKVAIVNEIASLIRQHKAAGYKEIHPALSHSLDTLCELDTWFLLEILEDLEKHLETFKAVQK
jgi:hypothetical protein